MRKIVTIAVLAIGMIAFSAPEAAAHRGANGHRHHKKVVVKKNRPHQGRVVTHKVGYTRTPRGVVRTRFHRPYRNVRVWVPGYFTYDACGVRIRVRGHYKMVRRYR